MRYAIYDDNISFDFLFNDLVLIYLLSLTYIILLFIK